MKKGENGNAKFTLSPNLRGSEIPQKYAPLDKVPANTANLRSQFCIFTFFKVATLRLIPRVNKHLTMRLNRTYKCNVCQNWIKDQD